MRVLKIIAYLIFTLLIGIWFLYNEDSSRDKAITFKIDSSQIDQIMKSLEKDKSRPKETAVPNSFFNLIDSLLKSQNDRIDKIEQAVSSPTNIKTQQEFSPLEKIAAKNNGVLEKNRETGFNGIAKVSTNGGIAFLDCPKKDIQGLANMELIFLNGTPIKSTVRIKGWDLCNDVLKESVKFTPITFNERYDFLNFSEGINDTIIIDYNPQKGNIPTLSFHGYLQDTVIRGYLRWGPSYAMNIELRRNK